MNEELTVKLLTDAKTELEKVCQQKMIERDIGLEVSNVSLTIKECMDCPYNSIVKYFNFSSVDRYDGYVNGSDEEICAVELLESIINHIMIVGAEE